MPFTLFNWYIWAFLSWLCQTSNGTTSLLKTFSLSKLQSRCWQWQMVAPASLKPHPEQSNSLPWNAWSIPGLGSSPSHCISFHLSLLGIFICLYIYFVDCKYSWFPWHGCVIPRWDKMRKKLLWIKSGGKAPFFPVEGQNHPSLAFSFPLCALCSSAAKWWLSIYC